VKGSRPERDQGSILRELVEIMPENILNDAWQMATTIQDPYARAIGMAAIANRNPACYYSGLKKPQFFEGCYRSQLL
jgi:hypothetical protein